MWRAVAVTACMTAMFLAPTAGPAGAAIVATVPLGTTSAFAVLGGSTVTNTGDSVLNGSLGVSPGTSITGFPPGRVVAPGTIHQTDAVAAQAQSDLTAAYVNAAGRPIDATTTADLGNLLLQGGVYAGPSKGALSLTGTLTLDGAGDPRSVFIFQTNSTLTTATGSTVRLINGAQACNVFWQVGSSATLGTGSTFVGNILALSSISLSDSVTVEGRALARNGAVTLINDTFTSPSCNTTPPTTTTTTTTTAPTTTTTAPTTTTTAPGSTGTAGSPTAPGTPIGSPTAPGTPIGSPTAPGTPTGSPTAPGTPGAPSTPVAPPTVSRPELPRTGSSLQLVLLALAMIAVGAGGVRYDRART